MTRRASSRPGELIDNRTWVRYHFASSNESDEAVDIVSERMPMGAPERFSAVSTSQL